MPTARSWLVAGLGALALAGCLPTGPRAPPTPNRYHGRLAIRAALMAAPHPPRSLEELGDALQRLEAISFDEDKDGALELDEWVEQDFATMLIFNFSHDGKLKLPEYLAYKETLDENSKNTEVRISDQREFELLDYRRRGFVTIDDIRDTSFNWFELNDVNRDGRVTDKEIDQVANSGSTAHLFP